MFTPEMIAALRAGGPQVGAMPVQNGAQAKPATTQKKPKSFLVDQISTVGGIIGGVGGGALGALAGGFGAVPGAALGSGAGSALGETLENVLTGDSLGTNVAKEGALGAVFGGGPLRLAKTAMGAKAALGSAKASGTSMGLKEAVKQGSDEAAKWSATGALGRKLTGKSTELATKQFGLTGNYINNFTKKFKEDPGKAITRYGFQSVDDVEGALTKQNEMFNGLISSASPIKKADLEKELNTIADDLLAQAPTGQQAVGQKIIAEMGQLLGQFGDDIPPAALNKARSQYDSLVNYTLQQSDPATYSVNKRVADAMRGLIQKASGSNQLKETGMEISKLIDLQEEMAKRAGTVANRNSSPLGLRNLLGAGVGGGIGLGAGGPVGGLIGAGAVAAINSPTGRRVATNAAIKGGNVLQGIGAKTGPLQDTALGTAGRIGGYNGLVANDPMGVQNAEAMSLEQMMMDQSQSDGSVNSMTNPMMSPNMAANNMGGQYQGIDPMSMAPQSPYSRQNLLADIQRDPANADKYIAYFQELDGIFGAQATQPEYNSNTATQLAMSDNGLSTLNQLEQLYNQAGGGSGKIGGGIQNLFASAGLNGQASSYNDLSASAQSQLAKAINGGGQVSDTDALLIANALPKITDSPQTAQTKLAALKQRLMASRQNMMMYNGGGQSGGLEGALMQQEGVY